LKKITKIFLALRHTQKGGERKKNYGQLPPDLIGSVGRERIAALVFPQKLKDGVDLFGTAICRTHQEISVLLQKHFPVASLHDPLEELGNEARFKDWVDRGLMEACRKTGSNLLGLKATLSSDEFTELVKACQSDLVFAFGDMTFDYAVGVLHTPMIELLAESYGFVYKGNLDEDTGFVFVRCEDTIHFMGFWQSEDPLPEIGDELPE